MKKSFKVISALFCVIILSLSVSFAAFAVETGTSGIFTYEYEYGKLIITGCDVPENGVVVIPQVINNNFVTEIGEGVFKGTAVKNVSIPDSVTIIHAEAFNECTSLERISVPAGLEIVEGSAFRNCSGIEVVCYSGSFSSWNNIQIEDYNDYLKNAKRNYHMHDASAATEIREAVEPDCTNTGYTGDTYYTLCGVIAKTGETIKENGHTSGGWKVVTEPTLDELGKEEERCSVCNALLDERDIPKLIGIERIEIDRDSVEMLNGSTVQLNATVYPENASNVTIYWGYTHNLDSSCAYVDQNGLVVADDIGTVTIKVVAKGENGEFSDTCEVTVLPRDFTVEWIVEGEKIRETVKEKSIIKKPADPEKDGYTFAGWTPEVPDTMPAKNMTFTAKFVLIANPDTAVRIEKPSVEKINYGDTLILHAAATSLPDGVFYEWNVEGTGVTIKPSEDGKTCAVTSTGNGDFSVTVKLVDANGEEIIDENGDSIEASVSLTSKAGFFQKLISFFKNLFGSDRIIKK
ncbi:MAG: leucine-rich repeat protein [Clostridia bacterium]|nr:leucine-rich repeat protein [Clostridia bacterium]